MSEETPIDWQYLAAAYRLEIVTSAEIKVAAERAITAGLYSHALDEIASSHAPILSDVGPLFATVLGELGYVIPQPLAAARTVTHRYMGRIARGELPPHKGMRVLIDDVYDGLDADEYREFSARGFPGLGDLIDGYYDCWEMEDRPELLFAGAKGGVGLRALARHMRKLASDWLARAKPSDAN